MKSLNSIKLIGCFMVLHLISYAQDRTIGQLFVSNDRTGDAILLKWVTPAFGALEGYHVYRQKVDGTTWVLLNTAPIKKLAALKLDPNEQDDAINFLEDYIKNNDLSKVDPFTLLLLSRKLVESNDFAKYLGLFYRDETVQNGQTYRYKVTQLKKNKENLVSISNPIVAKPFEPIDPPKGIEVFVDEKVDTQVNVFWKPEETRYFAVNIFRANEGQQSQQINANPAIPSQTTNDEGKLVYPRFFYSKGDHLVGKKYTYQLKGIDFFGNESQVSPPFEIEIIDRTPPPPPSDLQTERTGPRDIQVTWAESYGKNIIGYDVFVGDSLSAVFEKVNKSMLPASQTEYIFKVAGEKWGDYFFYVEAINALGTRSASTKMGLTVNDVVPPAVPTGLVATPFEGAIEISWNKQWEPDLFGYVVYRSVANKPGAPFALVSGGSIVANSFLDSLPREARNKYFYKVAAIDVYGNLSERSEIVSAIMPDVIAPISPTIIKLEIKNDTATITWLPSIDNELKGYHLYRCLESDTTQWTTLGGAFLSPTITEYTDTGLEPDASYCYQITAEDISGNTSEPSNRYTVKTRPNQGEDLVPRKLKATYNKRKKTATISWKPEAPPLVEGSILYRKEATGRFLPLTELLRKETEFVDPNVEPEKNYFYQLRTYYKDGNMTLSEPVEVVAK